MRPDYSHLRHDDPLYLDFMLRLSRATLASKPPAWEPDAISRDEAKILRKLGVTAKEQKAVVRLRGHQSAALPRPRRDPDQLDHDEYCEDMSLGGRRYNPLG